MITGKVTDAQAELNVQFHLDQGSLALRFVVDTGFTGALTLPASAVAALGLPLLQEIPEKLADDSAVRVGVHVATIHWNGTKREVAVLAMGVRPLLGTALLDGCRLSIEFSEDGDVQVEPL